MWMQVDTLSSALLVQKLLEIQVTKNVDFQIWEEKEEGIISKAIKGILPTLLLVSIPYCCVLLQSPLTLLEIRRRTGEIA